MKFVIALVVTLVVFSCGFSVPVVSALLHCLYGFAYRFEMFAVVEPVYRAGVAWLGRLCGADSVLFAAHLDNLAVIFNARGKYHEAEPLYKRSLAIYKRSIPRLSGDARAIAIQSMLLAVEDYASLLDMTDRSDEGRFVVADASRALKEWGESDIAARLTPHKDHNHTMGCDL